MSLQMLTPYSGNTESILHQIQEREKKVGCHLFSGRIYQNKPIIAEIQKLENKMKIVLFLEDIITFLKGNINQPLLTIIHKV